jgi:hypothetical protein
MEVSALIFLAVCFVSAVISIGYTIVILYRLIFYLRDKEHADENITLLQAARCAAQHVLTPVFGEAEWFVMIGCLILGLICRAGWHNSLKLVTQLEWRQEGSSEESH